MTFDWLLTRGLPEEAPKIEKNGALIYVRVSDRKQVKNGSLETQKEACSRHCQENGFEIIDVIEDAGYSGAAGDRPGIMRMTELIKERHDEIGYVITHVMDRASRQTDQWVVFRNALSKYDVVLESVTERINTSTEAGTAMADRQVALAAVERLSILRRTHEGTVSARTRGCPTYPAPLGYSNAKLAGIGATFLREEPTWEVIAQMYDLLDQGGTLEDAAAHAAANHITSKRSRPMTAAMVRRLVLNPAYAGYIRTPDRHHFVRGNFDPIVSEAVFERVARKLKGFPAREEQRHVQSNPKYPLGQVLRCPYCGRSCSGYETKGHRYYKCPGHGCRFNINADNVEQAFSGIIGRAVLHPAVSGIVHEEADAVERAAFERLEGCRRSCVDRIVKLTGAQDAVIGKISSGNALESLLPIHDKLERNLARERSMLEYLNRLVPGDGDLSRDLARTLQHPGEVWASIPPYTRRQFARELFPDGIVFDPGSMAFCAEPAILPIFHLSG